MPNATQAHELKTLLGRALCYRWAARLLAYPDEALLAALTDGSIQRELAEACAIMGQPAIIQEALSALWAALPAQDATPSLGAEHTYLFARQVRSSPYESRYRPAPSVSLTENLSDVSSFYEAFGFQVSDRAKEMPDHVSIELEFLAALYLKEAYALEHGWRGRARIAREARQKFLREHLAWWLPALAEKVQASARLPFYPAAAAYAHAVVGIKEQDTIEPPIDPLPG
ncbi:MAG: molecular chaperone TorD family protein [Chloroflexi bacterium]|nr:molecular chaperone TorD family protein [Chloroflexota bacterium]